jgi:dienelactone hydrolase
MKMATRWAHLAALGLCALPCSHLLAAETPAVERGMATFEPPAHEENVPERYRLPKTRFAYELVRKRDLSASGISIYHLTFPSPVKTSYTENNTVHADYYRPAGAGPFPCVIVLDILAGNEKVARLCASTLAQNGIGGLFVSLPYYGQRRPVGSRLRLLSPDLPRTMEAVRQSVLDLRCATGWMATRPEVDARRLGIMGTSLGSLVAALTAEMEPRLERVAILLGGGGFVDAYYDDPRARPYRKVWEATGGTRTQVEQFLAPVDPLTSAANLKDRKVLMIAAKHDDIILPKMTEALWNATGRQQIYWIDANHYSAALYLVPGLEKVVRFFNSN